MKFKALIITGYRLKPLPLPSFHPAWDETGVVTWFFPGEIETRPFSRSYSIIPLLAGKK